MLIKRVDYHFFIALLLVIIVSAAILIDSSSSAYLPCRTDCGETILAHQYISNYERDGWKYALLENQGTTEKLLLYTHNVNIGGLYYLFLDLIGVDTFIAKQIFVLLIFAIGLLYVFLSVN